MPETNDMTCAVCGGTWGRPNSNWSSWTTESCPADCHDEEKWAALDEMYTEEDMFRYTKDIDLVNENLRIRIAELEKDREQVKLALRQAIDAARKEKPDG